MIYITQLIYLKPGQEDVFDQFEAVAIPLIAKYRGRLLLRVRPSDDAYIEHAIEKPYEIHFVEFEDEDGLREFGKDPKRAAFLHLKEKAISSSIMVLGGKV